jgi:Spy/CpxP family protein refolding chaperone
MTFFGGKYLMKKLNFILFLIALAILSGMLISVVSVYAEDQQIAVDKNKPNLYDPCADPNCMVVPAITPRINTPNQMCPMMQNMREGMGMGMMHGKMMGMGKCPMCKMSGMMKNDNPMPNDPMSILDNADRLKLTDQQKMAIEATHLAHRKDIIKKQADLQIANVDLDALIKNDKPDLDAIKTQLGKIANMEVEIKFAHIKFGADIRSILTKEQLDTLKMIQKHEAYKAKIDDSTNKTTTKQEIKIEHHKQ